MDHFLEKDAFFFIVAQDRGIQAMIAAALSVEGFHRVLAFACAEDLLQTANTILPEVYIIDYEFPDMTSFEIYEQLQANERSIPCILLNAPCSPQNWEHCPLWTLQMPFTLDELFLCIQEALRSVSPLSLRLKIV